MNGDCMTKGPGMKGFTRTAGGALGLLIVLAIAVGMNVILRNFNLRIDLTEEKLYTLSRGTRGVLKTLQGPVTLKFFFSDNSAELSAVLRNYSLLQNYAGRVEDLLKQYESASHGKLKIEKYNPEPDSEAEDWAQRYGVAGRVLGPTGPTLYLGLVAEAGGEHSVIPFLDPTSEGLLEYNITRMLMRTAGHQKAVIGVMSDLPVMGAPALPYPMPGQPNEGHEPWVLFQGLSEDYEVRSVSPSNEEIDKDIDLLVLVHPRDLSDRTLYAIDQFVLRGGRLAAFVDPLFVSQREAGGPAAQFTSPDSSSSLNKLTAAWGVTVEPGMMIGDLEANTGGNPAVLGLQKSNMNQGDALTTRLLLVQCVAAGAIRGESTNDVTITPLLTSSASSSLISALAAQGSLDAMWKELKPSGGKYNVAVRIHGKLRTAFPRGMPIVPKDDAAAKEINAVVSATPAGLATSTNVSTVILAADADMLYDRCCFQAQEILGLTVQSPRNHNMSFFANVVEQLVGGPDLMAVRSRGKTDRPFEAIRKRQASAINQWLDRFNTLQAERQARQQKLQELETQKDAGQIVWNPELRTVRDRLRKELAQLRVEERTIRRKLRGEDVERLGMWLKLLNILLVPGIVVAAGIGFGLYRRSRMSAGRWR